MCLWVISVPGLAWLIGGPLNVATRVAEKFLNLLTFIRRNSSDAAALSGRSGFRKRVAAARYYAGLEAVTAKFANKPKISVLVPVYKVDPTFLEEALTSVVQQAYGNWELCIVDDASDDLKIAAVIERFAVRFPDQVKRSVNKVNMHISQTTNRCLEMATGEYVAFLDHDDRLYPNALAEMVRYINLHHEPDILYSDETLIDQRGRNAATPFFKPDWSRFLHLCMNYTTHFFVCRRDLVVAVGGCRPGYEGAQDHDLMLRLVEASKKAVIHVPMCLYQWREHAMSTANSLDAKPYALDAGRRAVADALQRRSRSADVEYDARAKHYRVRFDVPAEVPLVSIVIPSKDAPSLILRALNSVIEKSTYSNYEIVVIDNGTTAPATLEIYRSMTERLGGRFRAVIEPSPFNFGAQVNRGVALARGEYLLLLNNDTEVIAPTWIEEMLGVAQFPEVGAVGAKLLFGDGSIQHAGVFVSAEKIAEHAGITQPADDQRYWDMYNTMHEVSAVTAACLMITRIKYEHVGGFDEEYLPCGFGDVDFCLKLRRAGLVNVYVPGAQLFHHESASRGRSIEYFERVYMLSRWGKELALDPYLNPNLRRNARYEIDDDFLDLDLNAADFAYFQTTAKSRWIKDAQ